MAIRRKRGRSSASKSRAAKRRRTGPVQELKTQRAMHNKTKRVITKRNRQNRKKAPRSARGREATWVKTAMRVGRAPKRMSVAQMRKIATTRVVTRYQNIASVDRTAERGAHWLGPMYTDTNTITGSVTTLLRARYCENSSVLSTSPVPGFLRTGYHMYCLSHSGLKTGIHHVGYQPFINMSDGSVSFAALGVLNNTTAGAISTKFQLERASGEFGGDHKWIRNDWFDIRFNLRNAAKQQTWFDIWIFQFRDGYLDPLEEPSGAREREDRHAFYQGLARAGYANPMFPQPNMKQPLKKVRILKKLRVGFDKQLTTEVDTSPEMKYTRIFVRDGRVLDYQWFDQPASGAFVGGGFENTMLGTDWVPQGVTASPSDVPKARARTWMMVRAYDPRLASGTAGGGDDEGVYGGNLANNVDVTPSYDVCIRKSETVYAQ